VVNTPSYHPFASGTPLTFIFLQNSRLPLPTADL
jgi:hypothetical protein